MDQNYQKKVKTLATEDAEEENSAFIQLALSNIVVLREIFKFLPASTLKSCSLVNKLWKNECYSHCRDKLKWVAKISEKSPCSSLRDFNEIINSMTLVPYNGLSLHFNQGGRCYSCQCSSPGDLFTNVLDKLTWRHLEILNNEGFNRGEQIPCAAISFGMTLLNEKIGGLESLKFHLPTELQTRFNSNWPPALPNLETICFPQRCQRGDLHRVPTCFFTRLTNAAPNLKEINGWTDYKKLKCFAEEKWRCVKDFVDCNHPRVDNDLKVASKFVCNRPALRKLIVVGCGPKHDHVISNLLKMSRMTLEHLELANGLEANGSLQTIALSQLPKLRLLMLLMTSDFGHAMEIAHSLLNQRGHDGIPQLEEFHLSVFGRYGRILPDYHDQNDPGQPCTSVSKLQLQLDPSSSFVQTHHLFPAMTDLHIICQSCHSSSRFPYKQLFRLWQNMDRITICLYYREDAYRLDAAFCGLDEEEVELLQKEDDAFLMAVQLVPIAPCVLTMRNLVSFTIKSSEHTTYMTRVARVLAERYLPQTLVKVL